MYNNQTKPSQQDFNVGSTYLHSTRRTQKKLSLEPLVCERKCTNGNSNRNDYFRWKRSLKLKQNILYLGIGNETQNEIWKFVMELSKFQKIKIWKTVSTWELRKLGDNCKSDNNNNNNIKRLYYIKKRNSNM